MCRCMLHHPSQCALQLIRQNPELAIAVGDGRKVGHHHMAACGGEPVRSQRVVLGAAAPEALLAPSTTVNSPGTAATPVMAPVVPLTERPDGRPSALKAVGVLLAAIE